MYFLSIIYRINEIRMELRNPESQRETSKEVNFHITLMSDVWSIVAQAEGEYSKQGFRHRMEENEGSPQQLKTSRSRVTWKGRKMDFV